MKMRKKARQPNFFSNRKFFFNGVIGMFVLGAVISYLIQTNTIAMKGYQIKDLEQTVTRLRQASKELESKTLELQSMSTISSRVEKMNLVKVGRAKYLEPSQETARR